jgi:hypothetical protein
LYNIENIFVIFLFFIQTCKTLKNKEAIVDIIQRKTERERTKAVKQQLLTLKNYINSKEHKRTERETNLVASQFSE